MTRTRVLRWSVTGLLSAATLVIVGVDAVPPAVPPAAPPAVAPATAPSATPPATPPAAPPAGATGAAAAPATRPVRVRDLLASEMPGDGVTVPTPDEWTEVAEFCRQYLPNRWAYFEKVRAQRGEDSMPVQRLKARVAARYRALQITSGGDPTSGFYEQALAQITREDAAWGAAMEWHRDHSEAKLKALRQTARELVESVLDSKERQLSRLQDYVTSEQELLARQRSNEQSLVNKQVEQLMSDDIADDRYRGFGMYGRGRGFGWPGPGPGGFRRFRGDGGGPTTTPTAP